MKLFFVPLFLSLVKANPTPLIRGKVFVNGGVVDFKPMGRIQRESSWVEFPNGTISGVYVSNVNEVRQVTTTGEDIPVAHQPNTSCTELLHPDGRHLSYYNFTPGCYEGDSVTREYFTTIVTDVSFYQGPGKGTVNGTIDAIAELVSHSRLPFLIQMNVLLTIDNIYMSTLEKNFGYPTNVRNTTCQDNNIRDMIGGLDVLRSTYNWRSGTIHLLTGCWQYGTVGLAAVGRACANSYNVAVTSHTQNSAAWITFAHETGHALGAWHSFENGTCKTGGIMDYCDRTFEGVVQFHPLKRPEMCRMLQFLEEDCPKYFSVSSNEGSCGDLVLQVGEECECMEMNKVDCGACQHCKLQDESIECSVQDFVIRDQSPEPYVVTASLLSDPICCSEGKFRDANTECGAYGGACVLGKCTNKCKTFGLIPCPATEFGCVQPCRYESMSSCISTFRISRAPYYISHLPNGTSCANGRSVCLSGHCLGFEETASPTTLKPTRKKRRRTLPPTTSSPTSGSEYEEYQAPTTPPTLRCGDERQNLACTSLQNRLSCSSRSFCRWVKKGTGSYCQLRCSALSIDGVPH